MLRSKKIPRTEHRSRDVSVEPTLTLQIAIEAIAHSPRAVCDSSEQPVLDPGE
jgi:hypothetical protein